jgi:hypothetical protein
MNWPTAKLAELFRESKTNKSGGNMPRPTTKEQLLKEIIEERGKLEALLATIPSDVFATKKVLGEWTSKDIVSHLIAWEQMVILWVTSGIEGKTIPVPAEGFKWSDLPALNESIFKAHQNEAVEEVQNKFKDSYLQTLALLISIPEKDLFIPGLYKWQNKNMLSAYFKSCMSSHYLWARKEISKGLKV